MIEFSEEAIRLIYDYSTGIPRLINTICENALVIGCAQRMRTIVPDVIEEVASDFHLKQPKVAPENCERNPDFYGNAPSVIMNAVPVQS
jgi:hypothetical protein